MASGTRAARGNVADFCAVFFSLPLFLSLSVSLSAHFTWHILFNKIQLLVINFDSEPVHALPGALWRWRAVADDSVASSISTPPLHTPWRVINRKPSYELNQVN